MKGDSLLKKNICKVICCIAAVAAFLSVFCAVTVTGSGFLDLSNIARIFFIASAIILSVVSAITGIYGFKTK